MMKVTASDDDFIGFVFSFQDINNYYKVYSSKQGSGQGPWKLVQVGPPDKTIWTDPLNQGWKNNVGYRYELKHRPSIGLINLQIFEEGKSSPIVNTGDLTDFGLAGGRVGVICRSQDGVTWTDMSYKCQGNSKMVLLLTNFNTVMEDDL